MKSIRNKTINISLKDGREYLNRCIKWNNKLGLDDIKNKIIIGDTFKVSPKLQKGVIDLMIVDPPYNLRKNYNGNIFKKTNKDEYRKFTKDWIEATLPLLKYCAFAGDSLKGDCIVILSFDAISTKVFNVKFSSPFSQRETRL